MASGLMRASAVMASGTMVSRLLGFVKALLLVYAIGQTQSISADAFANGNLLPNTLYIVLLGGMLNAVLVPQIVKASQGPDGGFAYINKVLTLVLVALSAITAAAMLAAPLLVRLFAVSWGPEQLALATAFAYWCLPQILFYGLFTVLGEVLNARNRFGPFTWAPVLNNIIAIAGIAAFIVFFGADPDGFRTPADWTTASVALLAGSGTLGVIAQALILFVSWRRAGIRYRPDFAWRGMGLGQTARIASWSLATIVVMNLSGIITANVANTASGEGPSSLALQNAWLLFMLPHSVLAMSIGTAYFTRLAESGQAGLMGAFRRDFSASARVISLVMLYAMGVLFAAAPYISRVMQFGASPELVDQFALVLRAYLVGLAAYSFLFVVQRAFYALSDTRTPFIFTTIQIVLFSIGALMCLSLPKTVTAAGLAFAWAATTIVQTCVAVIMLHRKVGRIGGRGILRSLASSVPATLITTVLGVIAVDRARIWLPDTGAFAAIGLTALLSIAMLAVYALALWALRSPDTRELRAMVLSRLGRG